jgi:hypothetical protein
MQSASGPTVQLPQDGTVVDPQRVASLEAVLARKLVADPQPPSRPSTSGPTARALNSLSTPPLQSQPAGSTTSMHLRPTPREEIVVACSGVMLCMTLEP